MQKRKKIKIVIFVTLIAATIAVVLFYRNMAPKTVYEIAAVVRGQSSADPVEDKRSSLKYGDIVVVEEDGHKWSDLEKASFLILKINLNAKQKDKLLLPVYDKDSKTVLAARAYRVDMEKEFPEFKPLDLVSGQPFPSETWDWKIIKKK